MFAKTVVWRKDQRGARAEERKRQEVREHLIEPEQAVCSQAAGVEIEDSQVGSGGFWMACFKSIGLSMNCTASTRDRELHTSGWSSWADGETGKQNPIGLLISGPVGLC